MTSTQKAGWFSATFMITAMAVLPPLVRSDTVSGLNTFTAGETARASEVNQNFSAVESAVDGNDGLIADNEARIVALEGQAGVPGPEGEPGLQGAQGPAGADAPNFELVGFTSTTHFGDTGVFGFTRACEAEFSASRMCTSVEVMETVGIPVGLTGDAWVRPVFVSFTNGTTGDRAADASGINPDRLPELTCSGWTQPSNSLRGLTVDSDGGFRTLGCDIARAVACCRQVP